MTFKRFGFRVLTSVILAVVSMAAQAETFSVKLGSRTLGSLTYQGGASAAIETTLNNTPLGVFNGTFSASSTRSAGARQYHSLSKSSRKSREISVLIDNGRAVDVLISPTSEMTDLSQVAAVPVGVIDPVAAFGQFVSAKGCPSAFRFYDGRRAILLQPQSQSEVAGQLVCEMDYRVTDGPGHLSPLYIKSISVRLTYDMAGGQSLRKLQMSAAGFELELLRQE